MVSWVLKIVCKKVCLRFGNEEKGSIFAAAKQESSNAESEANVL
jgi:hypothetical protein